MKPGVMVFALLACGEALGAQQSVYIEDLTWPEVQRAIAAGKTSAIIYTGSTEQNGPHMAIGKHNFIARWVAGSIAIKLGDALVYPVLPFAITGDLSKKTGHMRFPGSVSFDPQTFQRAVHDIAVSAADAGFKKVFLMGDHGGGQAELAAVATELDAQWKARGVRVFFVDLYAKEKQQAKAYATSHGLLGNDVHAGLDDKSELIALARQQPWN